MQNNDFRGLTIREMAAIPKAIGATLDLTKIEVHNRRWTFLTPQFITVARGHRIYWPGAPRDAQTIAQLAHLVHETVHVWQYNVLEVGMYSLRWLDRRYRYELLKVTDSKPLALSNRPQLSKMPICSHVVIHQDGPRTRLTRTCIPIY